MVSFFKLYSPKVSTLKIQKIQFLILNKNQFNTKNSLDQGQSVTLEIFSAHF
jgi:hypothetical protein